MSAEVLRRAAALMRKNAGWAEPGVWKLWGMQVMADTSGTSNVDLATPVANCVTPSTTDRSLHTGNATHIASWHPAVTLSVAKAMDDVAHAWEIADEVADGYVYDADDNHYRFDETVDGGWLIVARAYLGES